MAFGKEKKDILHFDISGASSARALYQHHSGAMHKLQFKFETSDGRILEVEMNHEIAAPFIEQAIAAYSAIQRPIQFPRNIPFG